MFSGSMTRTKKQGLVQEELVESRKLEQEPEEEDLIREELQMNQAWMSSGGGIRHKLVVDVVNRQQDSDTANQTKRRTHAGTTKIERGQKSGPQQGVAGTK